MGVVVQDPKSGTGVVKAKVSKKDSQVEAKSTKSGVTEA